MTQYHAAFLAELHRQLVTLDCPVHRASLDEAVENALRTAGATVEQGWKEITGREDAEPMLVSNGRLAQQGYLTDYWRWWDGSLINPAPTHWRPLPAGPRREGE